MNTLTAGAKAPLFTLQDQQGNTVSLQECLTRGPVLVYFYPKASTPGCTVQACGLRDSKAELDSHSVTALGISPDPVAKLAKFAEKQSLNFTLLSDEDHSVADAFGVWGEKKFMGKIYDGIHRLSFLINTDGTIAHVFDKFKTSDHHQVVLAQIAGQ
ncbi:thioredoxin-dependent thiol peroxidase [Shewanella oneidensis MR-1]|uniref:thioredoxin-dependent peroxiredoxin n=1 Tax=Shewanella oneidensis (strain ATCC 700550 / JCM 31522 / CIP 106686 / LMG 19005 / NCIMB 14063 / MR-1) TaxID=211586 RepID=Q8EFT9_SHEON|nr:thioredoxin-dependent thiol peroxidase [Shewanella oneidensis]AAN54929.1 thioredoxin-dependent thiol peroxidase Bcp [Shewanella oneidensis MR-1]MDX5996354.1 thioredoxin-dependent thiol peroxidase [Shewanella oneidensis]MEE2028947.1 Peroxiredoxin Bcp [Shewanella oneidensis]QKG96533.1 thioredoxin-dependent thiol peroxidase [Shewanella oneidensis MR-1]